MTQPIKLNKEIKWVELIPCLIGRYSVVTIEDGDGHISPALYKTRAEAEAEVQDMQADYDEEIKAGERDPGDEYEGVIFPCFLDGDELILLSEDDYQEIERINWKNGN